MDFAFTYAKKVSIGFVLTMIVLGAMPREAEGRILSAGNVLHSPVTQISEDQPIVIESAFTTFVSHASVYYRTPGSAVFEEALMTQVANGHYKTVLKDLSLKRGDIVEYYILAQTVSGEVITYPDQNAEMSPVQLIITPKVQDASGGIDVTVLSPEPNSTVAAGDFFVAISMFSDSNIDVKKVGLVVDGNDVTKKADITEELVSYSDKNIADGEHSVKLWYAQTEENVMNLVEFSFSTNKKGGGEDIFSGKGFTAVSSTTQEAGKGTTFDENGKFRANFHTEYKGQNNLGTTTNYKRAGSELSYERDWFKIGASYDWDSQDDFRKNQPLSRYLLTANFAGIVLLDFGDAYPTFSPVTLYGTRVRGLNAGIYLGALNAQFVTGELNRKQISKADEDLLDVLQSPALNADSIVNRVNSGQSFSATFKRNFYGGRLSVGPQSFQFGISFTKVKDDQKSLHYNDSIAVAYNGLAPKENATLGVDFKLSALNKRLNMDASVATSLTNEDITGGSLSASEFADAGFTGINKKLIDNLGNFMTVNENLSIPFTGKLDNNFFAGTAGASLNMFNNNFNTRFRRNGAFYQSLASPVTRDLQSFEISDRVRVWENRVFVGASYGTTQNNLAKTNSNTLKTSNIGTSLSLFLPNQMPSITFGYNIISRDNSFNYDTTSAKFRNQISKAAKPEDNATNIISLSANYLLFAADLRHNLTLSFANSNKKNDTKDVLDTAGNTYYTAFGDAKSNSFGFGVSTEWKIPLRTNVSFNISSGQTETVDTSLSIKSAKSSASIINASGDYVLLNTKDMKWNANAGVGLTSYKLPGLKAASLTTFTFGQRFNFYVRHTIFIDFNLTSGLKKTETLNGSVVLNADGSPKTKNAINRVFSARYEFVF